MLEISGKTNLLEQNAYKYSLQDVAEPNLQRDIYTQGMVPKVPFNHRRVPMNMPEEIWITDTSLRDGQQSVEPYRSTRSSTFISTCPGSAGRMASSGRRSFSSTAKKTARRSKSAWSWG